MVDDKANQLKDLIPPILSEEVRRLEELVPLILIDKHINALEKLKQYPEKYNDVRDQAKRYLDSVTTLELLPKLKIDAENFREEDVKRLMYGIMVGRGYLPLVSTLEELIPKELSKDHTKLLMKIFKENRKAYEEAQDYAIDKLDNDPDWCRRNNFPYSTQRKEDLYRIVYAYLSKMVI